MGLICKSPEIPFNPTYHAIKTDYPLFGSVRHVSVLSALVLNVDIRKTKVIFAVSGVQMTVLRKCVSIGTRSPRRLVTDFLESSEFFTKFRTYLPMDTTVTSQRI
jgi:hypothetical protein